MDEKRLREIEHIAFRSKRSEEDKFRLRECVTEIRSLCEALAFYADGGNYDWLSKEMGVSSAELDRGKIARVALGLEK